MTMSLKILFLSLLTWQRKSEKREALKRELNEDLSLIA